MKNKINIILKTGFCFSLLFSASCVKEELVVAKKTEETVIVDKTKIFINSLNKPIESKFTWDLDSGENFTYDSKGRMETYSYLWIDSNVPFVEVDKFKYDEQDYLIKCEHHTYYWANIDGKLIKKYRGLAYTDEIVYDLVGKVIKVIRTDNYDRQKTFLDFEYDNRNQLKSITEFFGFAISTEWVETYAKQLYEGGILVSYKNHTTNYKIDKNGNIIDDGTNKYEYDAQNQVLKKYNNNNETNYKYDSKVNPERFLYKFKGFPIQMANKYPWRISSFYGIPFGNHINNISQIEYKSGGNVSSKLFEYEYNDKDIPVKIKTVQDNYKSEVKNDILVLKQ